MHRITQNEGNLITVRVSGKLTQADYDDLIPAWEQKIAEHGAMRMLLVMEDFHGWDTAAAWDDFRFGTSHVKHIERIALVGEKKWQEWLGKIGAIFMPEQVRYFDLANLDSAKRWVRAD